MVGAGESVDSWREARWLLGHSGWKAWDEARTDVGEDRDKCPILSTSVHRAEPSVNCPQLVPLVPHRLCTTWSSSPSASRRNRWRPLTAQRVRDGELSSTYLSVNRSAPPMCKPFRHRCRSRDQVVGVGRRPSRRDRRSRSRWTSASSWRTLAAWADPAAVACRERSMTSRQGKYPYQ